jgi:hypothetical protein
MQMTETNDTDTILDWLDGVGDLPSDTLVPVSAAAIATVGKWLHEWRERALAAEDKIDGLTFKKEHAEEVCESYRKQMLFFRDRKRDMEEENDNLRVDVNRFKVEIGRLQTLVLSYEARLDELSGSDPDKTAIEMLMAHSKAFEASTSPPEPETHVPQDEYEWALMSDFIKTNPDGGVWLEIPWHEGWEGIGGALRRKKDRTR